MGVKLGRPRTKRIIYHLTNKEADRLYEGSVRIIRGQNPSYYFSFCGNKIFRDYYIMHNMKRDEAEMLTIFHFHKFFLQKDLDFWGYHGSTSKVVLNRMVSKGYVSKVKAPTTKSTIGKLNMIVPNLVAIKFIEGYKEYYDARIKQLFDSASKASAKKTINDFKKQKSVAEKKFDKELWETRIMRKKTAPKPVAVAKG